MKLKENKGVSLVGFVIVLLVILVLVFAAGFVYLLNNPVKEKVAIQNPTGVQSNLGSVQTNVENQKEPITNNETKVEIVKEKMTSDEKFQEYIKNLNNEISNLEEGTTIGGEYSLPVGDSSYYLELDSNHNLSIRFTDDKLEKTYGTTKLMTDVIAYYNVYIGQDASRLLCVLKSDGTLWSTTIESVCWEKNYKISFKQETKFKNIVSVLGAFGSDAMYPLFVDVEGKVYKED